MQCVALVLARGTTTTDEDWVRQMMPPFVHAAHDHGMDIPRPETAARNR
jgi:hypothetical protein